MDFTRFINSRDIREHIRQIGYEFSSVEAAWIVWQSAARAPEKHEAWEYIITNMPDTSLEERGKRPSYESLHDALRNYMDIERRWLKKWSEGDGKNLFGETDIAVYRIHALTKSGNSVEVGPVYSSWSMARDHFTKKHRDPENVRYVISRELLNRDTKPLFVSFTPDGEAVSVYSEKLECREDFILYSTLFGEMDLIFPTPFRAGDILHNCRFDVAYGPYDNTFVFSHMTNGSGDVGESSSCGTSVFGYFLLDGSKKRMVSDHISGSVMDLEYYRGDTEGEWRIFKHFSDYTAGLTCEAAICENYKKVISGDGEYAMTYYEEL
ncbi:MAG: hypothetical protein IJO81_05815 [Clostridia bacterium]|nr:hypothetical protein [Clostridia bacterium]